MHQVLGIKAIITQIVDKSLVGREIGHSAGKPGYDTIDRKMQGRLGELIAVQPIGEMAYGTHREYYIHGREFIEQPAGQHGPPLGYLLDLQPSAHKPIGRELMTVAYNPTGVLELVYISRSERNDQMSGRTQCAGAVTDRPVYSLEQPGTVGRRKRV